MTFRTIYLLLMFFCQFNDAEWLATKLDSYVWLPLTLNIFPDLILLILYQ